MKNNKHYIKIFLLTIITFLSGFFDSVSFINQTGGVCVNKVYADVPGDDGGGMTCTWSCVPVVFSTELVCDCI